MTRTDRTEQKAIKDRCDRQYLEPDPVVDRALALAMCGNERSTHFLSAGKLQT